MLPLELACWRASSYIPGGHCMQYLHQHHDAVTSWHVCPRFCKHLLIASVSFTPPAFTPVLARKSAVACSPTCCCARRVLVRRWCAQSLALWASPALQHPMVRPSKAWAAKRACQHTTSSTRGGCLRCHSRWRLLVRCLLCASAVAKQQIYWGLQVACQSSQPVSVLRQSGLMLAHGPLSCLPHSASCAGIAWSGSAHMGMGDLGLPDISMHIATAWHWHPV